MDKLRYIKAFVLTLCAVLNAPNGGRFSMLNYIAAFETRKPYMVGTVRKPPFCGAHKLRVVQ